MLLATGVIDSSKIFEPRKDEMTFVIKRPGANLAVDPLNDCKEVYSQGTIVRFACAPWIIIQKLISARAF